MKKTIRVAVAVRANGELYTAGIDRAYSEREAVNFVSGDVACGDSPTFILSATLELSKPKTIKAKAIKVK